MEINIIKHLALEIFKTLNNLNPTCAQDLFYLHSSSARWPNNIAVVRTNTNTNGTKSLRSLGPHIWNSLPEHIKAETSNAHFWSLINTWFGKECLRNLYKNTRTPNSTIVNKSDVIQLTIQLLLLLGLVLFFLTVLTYAIVTSNL